MMSRSTVLVGLVLVVALASPALAQSSAEDVGGVQIAAGAGLAHSFHGDLNFNAPAWEVELAVRRSAHVSIEAAFGQWRHVEETVLFDVPIQGPEGLIGRADRIEQRQQRVFSAFEVNALGGGRVGRVRLWGGGGGGFLVMNRTFRQITEGCSGTATCGTFENTFSSVSPTVQAIGRLEVPLGPRVSAYVSSRLWINLRDVGGSGVRTMAGIRIGY
jgi:hypothetical protein